MAVYHQHDRQQQASLVKQEVDAPNERAGAARVIYDDSNERSRALPFTRT